MLSRAIFLLGVISLVVSGARASALEVLLEQARIAEARFDPRGALEFYLQAEKLRPEDPVILQKVAQQLSDMSLTVAGDAEKKAQAEQALAYAKRAVALAPDNAVNVLSLAICYGKMGVYSDTRTKLEYSRLVREKALEAVTLDPDYDWAHHVLGRWHYEVAGLGATTRFFVRVIYGGLPEASHAEAVRRLEKAVELAPLRVPHHLELGFAYAAAGREKEARASFERGLALPSTELYDESAKERARAALEKL